MVPSLPLFYSYLLQSDNFTIGILVALYTIAALFIRPFTGIALDVMGRKYIFLISFFLFGAFYFAYPIISSFAGIILLRILHGFTWGALTSSSTTVAVDLLPPERRGEGLGFFGLAMTLAMGVGPLIGLWIIGSGNHFDYMFYTGATLSLAGFLLAMLITYKPFTPHPNHTGFKFENIFERTSLPVALAMLLLMIPYGGLLSFVSKYGLTMGIANPGIFFISFAIGIGLSRIFSGKIFDTNGPLRITITGIISLIFGFLILSLMQNIYGYLGSAFILGIGIGIIFPVFQAMVNNIVSPQKRGVANATLFTALDIGIGFGIIFTGWASMQFSFPTAFLFSSGISFLGLIWFFKANTYYKSHKLNNKKTTL